MIGSLLDRLPGLNLARLAVVAAALAALAWGAVALVGAIEARDRRIADVAATARDAHWRAEIATSNAAVERARAEQAAQALAAEAAARAEIDRLSTALNDLEARNAQIPGGNRVGLSRERVRALPR